MELTRTNTVNTQAPISYNGGLFSAFVEGVKTYFETRKAIGELESMTDLQLMDIGVARSGIKAAVKGDLYR